MKKLFAILLALSLLLTMTAFAEEEKAADEEVSVATTTDAAEERDTTIELDEFFNFNITMDEIPEGYDMYTFSLQGITYAVFSCEGKPDITVSVAHSEEFTGYTLDLSTLTEEEKKAMAEGLSEGFYDPSISYTKTTHGTDLIVINENGVDTDTVQILGLYDGYIISCEIFNEEGDVTDEDIETAVKIISEMWFEEETF